MHAARRQNVAITNLSQVSDRLSSTGKFVIAASHRSRVFGTSVSSSFSPLVSSCFILAPSARWRSVESARDGAVCRRNMVKPPVFVTAARKRRKKNLLSAASHLVTWRPVASAGIKPCQTQNLCFVDFTKCTVVRPTLLI